MEIPKLAARLDELITHRPERARVLLDFGISLDAGDLSLHDACAARGVDPESVAFALWALDRELERCPAGV